MSRLGKVLEKLSSHTESLEDINLTEKIDDAVKLANKEFMSNTCTYGEYLKAIRSHTEITKLYIDGFGVTKFLEPILTKYFTRLRYRWQGSDIRQLVEEMSGSIIILEFEGNLRDTVIRARVTSSYRKFSFPSKTKNEIEKLHTLVEVTKVKRIVSFKIEDMKLNEIEKSLDLILDFYFHKYINQTS